MGNSVSHRQSGGATTTGKVILSDGAVFKYDKPVTAAELMLEHPQEVVVELDGKRPSPLPADENLDMKKLYIMLPIKKGKPATLSYQEAKELLTKTNSLLKSKTTLLSYTGFLPMFVRICHPSREHDAPVSMDTRKEDYDFGAVSELEGRPEFLSRQISGKGWKPSLDTINEKSSKAKPIHWWF